MKKMWSTIKEVIGKTKTFKNYIPKRMDATNVLLKLGLHLHLQYQPLPKISNNLWMSQKHC